MIGLRDDVDSGEAGRLAATWLLQQTGPPLKSERALKRIEQLWSVQKSSRAGAAILCADNGATYEMDAHRARRIAKAINADIEEQSNPRRSLKLKPGYCLNWFRLKRSKHNLVHLGERICRICQKAGFCHICGGKLHTGEKKAHGACMPQVILEIALQETRLPKPLAVAASKAIEAADRMHRINAENL